MYNFVKNTDIDIFDTLFNVDVDLFHARREDRAITLDMVPAPIFIRTNYDNKNGILTATFKAMVKLTEIPVELELNEKDYYLFEVNDWEGISNTMVKIFEEAHRLAEQYKPGSTVEVRISGSHTKWVIVSEEGYWNNTDGWVEHKVDASTFDHSNYNLPIGQDCRWEQTTEGVSLSKMKPIFERTLSSLTYMVLRMALENRIFGEPIEDRDYISNVHEELELFVTQLHNSLCDEEVINHVKAVIMEELEGGSYFKYGPERLIQGLQEFLRDDLYASEEVQELFLSLAKEIAGDISGNE